MKKEITLKRLHLMKPLWYNLLKNNKKNKVFMNILMLPFEEPLTFNVNGETVKVVAFKTQEHGNIKFGVDAPRSVNVHREEIYHAIKQKEEQENLV